MALNRTKFSQVTKKNIAKPAVIRKVKDPKSVRDALTKAGYSRSHDLLMLKPAHYDDETKLTLLADAPIDKPFLAEVVCIKQSYHRFRLTCVVADGTAKMSITFMNSTPGIRKVTSPGCRFRIFGRLQNANKFLAESLKMIHPRIRNPEARLTAHLTARYPNIAKVTEAKVARMVIEQIENLDGFEDPITREIRKDTGTFDIHNSFNVLHRPLPDQVEDILAKAIYSLKFDEWLAHILLQSREKIRFKRKVVLQIKSCAKDIDTFEAKLPFKLTNDQRKTMQEIAQDLNLTSAMRRLLHGDVGCGKTLVAAYACWLVARAGHLAAIMCPTTILASQHHFRLSKLFAEFNIDCYLFTSSVSVKARKLILTKISKKSSCVIIGTHALVQEKTQLPNLRLAVVDEQQRFGVAQNKKLESKGDGAHVLLMSATPIPRTLELGQLAQLDISKITERPNNVDIRTMLFSSNKMEDVLHKIIKDDLQTYWICPLICKSSANDLRTAETEFEKIKQLAPKLKSSLIHGKIDNLSKIATMRDFESGKIRLLVATTVVEVGVDAPLADVIVIDHAERFGLSQLHQLRGRVGRSTKTGFCALLYESSLSDTAIKRLQIMRECNDGFAIAQHDLMLRGPGDIIGKRQSGPRKYRFAEFDDDPALLNDARNTAKLMLDDYPDLAYEHAKFWLGGKKRQATALDLAPTPPQKD